MPALDSVLLHTAVPANALLYVTKGDGKTSFDAKITLANLLAGATLTSATYETLTATTEFRGPVWTSNAASALALKTSGGTQFEITHAASVTNYFNTYGGNGNAAKFGAKGASTDVSSAVFTKGAGSWFFQTNDGVTQFVVSHTASAVEYLQITGAASGGAPTLSAAGASTNLDAGLAGKGTGGVRLSSNFARYLLVTGSAGGAVTLQASDGAMILSAPAGGATVQSPQSFYAHTATAIPAGGTAGAGYRFSSTANFGIFFGSGAPTLAAAKGSFYLRSDGSTTNDRAYINTNGSTTWTALTTAV